MSGGGGYKSDNGGGGGILFGFCTSPLEVIGTCGMSFNTSSE